MISFSAHQKILISDTISQLNKLHLAIGWSDRGEFIEWRWTGEPLRSRVEFQFEPNGEWHVCKSFEFDVRPKLKWAKEMKLK